MSFDSEPRALQRSVLAPLLVALLVGVPVAGGDSSEAASRSIGIDLENAARVAVERGGEAVHMRWKFSGFLGFLAGLFLPNSGDALLTFIPDPDGRRSIEMPCRRSPSCGAT